MLTQSDIIKFITESNSIERVYEHPSEESYRRYAAILRDPAFDLDQMIEFVHAETGMPIRHGPLMNATVSGHHAPRGGLIIPTAAEWLILEARRRASDVSPWEIHNLWMWLHPFLDGNGRSGRLLWLYCCIVREQKGTLDMLARRGFLQTYYYETLGQMDMRTERLWEQLGWEFDRAR